MERYTIAVLVRNQFGVLNRVTSMFRRRQFNINSLTVSETESDEYSRITVTFEGGKQKKDQLINQLYKLPDVSHIKELGEEGSVNYELLLLKVKNEPETREDIRAAAEAFKAKTVDYTWESIILQITGTTQRIDAFIKLMSNHQILEICRTGVVSLERGAGTIRKSDM